MIKRVKHFAEAIRGILTLAFLLNLIYVIWGHFPTGIKIAGTFIVLYVICESVIYAANKKLE